ncbi:MAG: M23 family metallopeptidase [Clostridia bacterium]|nr:M23 family metallopeptidase [Clostridia bacterium]
MRTRTVISAIIFLLLSAFRLCAPKEALQLRNYIIPAISRQAGLLEDLTALGQAISGERSYIYVWERFTNTEKAVSSVQTPAEDLSPLAKTDVSGSFPLSEMVEQNLSGFMNYSASAAEDSSSSENSEAPVAEENTESPSPSDTADTPSASPELGQAEESLAASETMNSDSPPIAPDTAPIDSTAPASAQSEKLAAFLEAQAAFADYAVPANVSYDTPALPFEYSNPCVSSVTSGFGYREHPIEDVVKFHYGTDIGAYDGDAVCAFADGTVISVQVLSGYGRTIMLDHGNGFQTLYAHCSQILAETGALVKRGDKIALVGHSGDVTGPHLHFELLYNGKYLNPEFYLQ